MNNRALILWACIGILLLTAAKVTTNLHTAEAEEVPAATVPVKETPVSSEPRAQDQGASERSARFKLLSAAYGPSQPTVEQPRLPSSVVNESTLWLARAIYSETKLPHEQELVAWVVRNRVETQYRGQTTYKGVVLDPYQFSAFNPDAPKRSLLMHLTPEVRLPSWQQALWIAHYVRHANPAYRPFSIETRHFYSERSMEGRQHPYWVNRQQFVSPDWDYRVNERRFRFYKEIS
jgi:hypothetical protein